jgi:hypothetical protein
MTLIELAVLCILALLMVGGIVAVIFLLTSKTFHDINLMRRATEDRVYIITQFYKSTTAIIREAARHSFGNGNRHRDFPRRRYF